MPTFFFNLATPAGREVDELGSACPTADHAVVEATCAALEISIDHLRRGLSPVGFRFEVCNDAGQLVFELPFSEVLAAPARQPPVKSDSLHSRLHATMATSRRLQDEVAAAVGEVCATLAATRALLAPRN